MWQLHSGSAEWLGRVATTRGWWGCDEYDVADCFLNTPRDAVLDAITFWLEATQRRSRRQPCFAISKDGKGGDHRGQPCSAHYWAITAKQLLLACGWDLENNAMFEAQVELQQTAIFKQHKGLPIGGHLSAAYVELVALRRELQCPWPVVLRGLLTARYRDNFFVILPNSPDDAHRALVVKELSALLMMPVGFERGGRIARCLELRIDWTSEVAVKAVLAYRTDEDRQGKAGMSPRGRRGPTLGLPRCSTACWRAWRRSWSPTPRRVSRACPPPSGGRCSSCGSGGTPPNGGCGRSGFSCSAMVCCG